MVKELSGYPVQNCPSGISLFWGGPVGRGGIVYDTVWMGCPRRTPWIMLRRPVCFRILSSPLTSVSIFSVCCYSIVSISLDTPERGRWSRTRSNKGRRNFVLTLQTLSSCELTLRAITLHGPPTPFVSLAFGSFLVWQIVCFRSFDHANLFSAQFF